MKTRKCKTTAVMITKHKKARDSSSFGSLFINHLVMTSSGGTKDFMPPKKQWLHWFGHFHRCGDEVESTQTDDDVDDATQDAGRAKQSRHQVKTESSE